MNVKLYIPKIKELSYRKHLLSDIDTMSHNKNQDTKDSSYNKETGCIDFSINDWPYWYKFWISNIQNDYYGYSYIKDIDKDIFVGEVVFYHNQDNNNYSIGVLVEHKYRRLGYGVQALKEIIAFIGKHKTNIDKLYMTFNKSDEIAIKTYLKAGFKALKEDNNIVELEVII